MTAEMILNKKLCVGKLMACAAVAFVLSANADEFTLKSNLEPGFDWSLGSSYDGGNAPGTGDTIVVPSGMTATLSASDSTSFDFVSSRARVTPLGTFVIDVASGSTTFGAAISLRDKANSAIGAGTFQKTGAHGRRRAARRCSAMRSRWASSTAG